MQNNFSSICFNFRLFPKGISRFWAQVRTTQIIDLVAFVFVFFFSENDSKTKTFRLDIMLQLPKYEILINDSSKTEAAKNELKFTLEFQIESQLANYCWLGKRVFWKVIVAKCATTQTQKISVSTPKSKPGAFADELGPHRERTCAACSTSIAGAKDEQRHFPSGSSSRAWTGPALPVPREPGEPREATRVRT